MNEKLVRDGYETKFQANGTKHRKVGSPSEHDKLLEAKHVEELDELNKAIDSGQTEKISEEAADLIESIYDRAALNGVSRIDIETTRREKRKKLGGFQGGIVLISED